MAVVNIKSSNVSNADAAVQTQSATYLAGGKKYSLVGTAAIAAADDDGSFKRIGRVHSSWRILSVKLFNDAITAGSWALGLYRTAADGGAQVGSAVYNPTIAGVATASLTGAEVSYSANRAITKIGQHVWQDAGLTADPGIWYDLAFTCVTAGTAAGNVAWEAEFMQGSS